jgi:hypothetical protein
MLNGHIRESFEQIRGVSGRINHLSADLYALLLLLLKQGDAFCYEATASHLFKKNNQKLASRNFRRN